jgi:hypothetical protein
VRGSLDILALLTFSPKQHRSSKPVCHVASDIAAPLKMAQALPLLLREKVSHLIALMQYKILGEAPKELRFAAVRAREKK